VSETNSHTDVDADRGTQDKAREGLEHLQAAARELIQAARAMLDVAEDLVNDPETVASVAGTVGALGDLVRHRAGGPARRSEPGEPGEHGEPDAAAPAGAQRGRDGSQPVQRITVS
jgi:hypothetical protein